MDLEKIVSKITESKKFCTTYKSKERSIDCDRQGLEEDIKRKSYYLKMIEDYTTMVSEVDEKIKSRERRMESNVQFVEENRDKFTVLSRILNEESEKILSRVNKTVEALNKERENESDQATD